MPAGVMRAGPLLCVVGARPNLMKIAPIMRALQGGADPVAAKLVHTGQHYGNDMNGQFFQALGIPQPCFNLEVGSDSHARQTAEIMRRFEPVVDAERPGAVLVVGDVNSTLACALVAAKKGAPVVHVEAGLRSFDRAMPEEINRVLTDQIAELLFTTEKGARDNLLREGIDAARIHFVGNVMIDTLHWSLERAVPASETLSRHGAPAGPFAVLTLHRPSNVDEPATLRALLGTVGGIARRLPVVFPVHPRTRAMIDVNQIVRETLALRAYEQRVSNVTLIEALASGLPPIFADGHQIKQVLLNLVINAEQAMLAEHGRGTLVVRTWHDQEQGAVVLEVNDDGPGVPEEVQSRIFDPFFTTKEVGKGTGLGLSVAYALVHEHGGRIWVRSEKGSGASFFVALPVTPRQAEPRPPAAPPR